jgi:hypothetical protein
MENAVELMAGLSFLAIGLSHVLRPKEWTEFFAMLSAKGAPGAFINGMLSLSFGSLIVGFHSHQRTGLSAIVTFIGWAQVLKGAIHLCFPAHSLRSMKQVEGDKYWKIAWAGGLMIPMAALMIFASTR